MADEKIRSLLLIDAEAAERRLVSPIASRSGWTVINAPSVDGAIEVLRGAHGREVQAAILGQWSEEAGPQAIEALREVRSGLSVIVIAAGDSVAAAVSAMRAGATDFL